MCKIKYYLLLRKKYPQILNREIVPYDWNEKGYVNKDRPNDIETWKTERKINRIRNYILRYI